MAPDDLDLDLHDLPEPQRLREWMGRIEAVLFASATPVSRRTLAKVLGQGADLDALIAAIQSELDNRPYELAEVAGGWMLRTRAPYAAAVKAARDPGDRLSELADFDVAVLAAIAYNQPITRNALKDIFGKEVGRNLIGRLREMDLVSNGPRSPRPGAPITFVTTDNFLTMFDLTSLRDLPDRDELREAGFIK